MNEALVYLAGEPTLEADWDSFCAIESEIGTAESTGINARWRCGRMLLRYEKRPGSKDSPLAAVVRRLAAEFNVSERELLNRRQFAEEYPNLCPTGQGFESWDVIKNETLGERNVHHSSETPEWATPQDLFDLLDDEFGFEVDVCATSGNAKCERYFSQADDGLKQEWSGACWMNPPYGREIAAWMRKAHEAGESGAIVVCLIPARTDTDWWWDYARHGEVRFLHGRLRFGDADIGAPFPSAVVIFGREAQVVWWETWRA